MKVILVNGSPHIDGCTKRALDEVAKALNEEDIETENFFISNSAVNPCIACRKCKEKGACIFNDEVNIFTKKAEEADGFVFGTPVHFSHPSAKLLNFMDRAFYSNSKVFAYKPACAVISARRAGTTASFDVLNKYFSISSMPIVTSTYWNHVYGSKKEDVEQDKEGLMTMYNLGKNMAWLLKSINQANINHNENKKVLTNFRH